ncbi:MAG: hypothetical protein Q7K44_05270 [Candidatus Liptonbacteria bacterium]|nr:hypothetical protein [Candidatus Liptonbacteria bacterium]
MEELDFVGGSGTNPDVEASSWNGEDDTRHHVAVLLEDLAAATQAPDVNGLPLRVNSDRSLLSPERRGVQRVGVKNLAELKQSQQKTDKQNCHYHCTLLFRIHGLPLFPWFGMCDRVTMTRLLRRDKFNIFSALGQAQQKITIAGVSYLLTHIIKKFSSPKMRNRQFSNRENGN